MKKRILIGLGTGRCGTTSLYRLLNFQKNSNISHELEPILTWKFNKKSIDKKIFQLINKKEKYVGDVAFYYLPYIEYIIKKFPQIKFICLKRIKKEVVKSFVTHTNKWNWNHWIVHIGNKWKKAGKWDDAFPKYNLDSKEKAITRYYEDYYKEIRKLIKKYPKNVNLFKIDDLNNQKRIKKILDFCKIEDKDQKIITNIKENKSHDKLFSARYRLWRANKL